MLKKQEIISSVSELVLSGFVGHVELNKTDLLAMLELGIRDQVAKIKSLPEDVSLELLSLDEIEMIDNQFLLKGLIKVIADKLLLPKISHIAFQIRIQLLIEDGKLQLAKPEIEANFTDKNWKHRLLNPILDRLIAWKDDSIMTTIDSKINPIFRNPSLLKPFLPQEIRDSHEDLISKLDYQIFNLDSESDAEVVRINSKMSLFTDKNKLHKHAGFRIELAADILLPALLKQINSDIDDKVKQDVDIHSISVGAKNRMIAKGRAGVMNILKDFEVHSRIAFDYEEQRLKIVMVEIKVEGSFLVRQGFKLVEPKIRSMLDSKLNFDLKELLFSKPMHIDKSESIPSNYEISLSKTEISSVDLEEIEGNLILDIVFQHVEARLGPGLK